MVMFIMRLLCTCIRHCLAEGTLEWKYIVWQKEVSTGYSYILEQEDWYSIFVNRCCTVVRKSLKLLRHFTVVYSISAEITRKAFALDHIVKSAGHPWLVSQLISRREELSVISCVSPASQVTSWNPIMKVHMKYKTHPFGDNIRIGDMSTHTVSTTVSNKLLKVTNELLHVLSPDTRILNGWELYIPRYWDQCLYIILLCPTIIVAIAI